MIHPSSSTRATIVALLALFLSASFALAHDGDDHAHQHGTVEAPAGITVSLDVSQDPMSGYNVHIVTTGFTWAPERASREHLAGEGHAHLYVNGEKVARVYGPWYHLGDLPGGGAEVRVTLNTNAHDDYAHDGVVVADSVTVMASDAAEGAHEGHGDAPDDHDDTSTTTSTTTTTTSTTTSMTTTTSTMITTTMTASRSARSARTSWRPARSTFASSRCWRTTVGWSSPSPR